MNDKNIQVRFPHVVWEQIKAYAEEDERSFNGQVIWILRQFIKERGGITDGAQNVQVSDLPDKETN